MAATRLISIVGRKNSGKTTLAVALSAEYARRGHEVAAIKHAHHPATIDTPGTDSYRHFHEGKASKVLLASPDVRGLFERTPDDTDPVTLTRRYLADSDVVIVEGFSREPLPKIEVFRKEVAPAPIYGNEGSEPADWVAIVTDDDTLNADCTVLRFHDTMWLQLLANIAWDSAKIVGP